MSTNMSDFETTRDKMESDFETTRDKMDRDFETTSAKMESDFNRSRNIMIGCFVGFVVLMLLCGLCSKRRAKKARQQVQFGSGYQQTSGTPLYATNYVADTDIAQSSALPMVGYEAVAVSGLKDSSNDNSSYSCTQSADPAPSAPAFESSSSASASYSGY